ncbi:MAG: energy-coupling factor ABC transporter permease [Lachnospiraceae bacterium]|nr:energy-coupling factor ABC transporter permease [Lachnospiraceae bacterium]
MHMADALLSPAVACGMYALSAGATAVSINKLREDEDILVPKMGVLGAFVFAAQMANFTIPGTGASGHICGGMLLSAMLGPYAGFVSMIGILLIQCLFFADGGLMALGGNIWNMAFYGCFLGGAVIWKLFTKKGLTRTKIVLASVIGSTVSLSLGAFSVTLETLISKITTLPFGVFLGAMIPIHIVIGVVEGLLTAAVLIFVYETRPEFLWTENASEKDAKMSAKSVIAILAVMTVVLGAGVSLLASSNPDGLEWSVENVAGDFLESAPSTAPQIITGIQEKLAFMPDYGFKNSDSAVATSLSGVVGSLIVVALVAAGCYLLKAVKKKNEQV